MQNNLSTELSKRQLLYFIVKEFDWSQKHTAVCWGWERLTSAASGIFAVSEVQNQKGIGEDMDLSVSTGSFAPGSKAAALVCRRLS